MKAIKVLVIALVAAFTINTVSAQTTTPVKAGTQKSQTKKGHKHHHHKKHTKAAAKA